MQQHKTTIRLFSPVIAAVFLAVIYYGLIASDLYVTTASFIIRGAEAPHFDAISMLTGIPGDSSSIDDAYALKDYLLSRDLLTKMRADLPLQDIYRRKGVDFSSRLEKTPSLESLQDYWKSMIGIDVEKQTALVTLRVRAFTPQDSMAVTQALIKAGETRMNEMSMRSRQDTLKIADEELAKSIANLNQIRSKLSEFSRLHKMIDPAQTAVAQQGISEKLEQELVSKTAERASLMTYMQPTAPQVETLEKRIISLREILDQENTHNIDILMTQGNHDEKEAQALIDEYNQMVIDRDVAEKAYVASTEFLETARIDTMRQRRYLSFSTEPTLAEEAVEPERLKGVFMVFIFSMLLWGVGQLILATIREHRQWNA